MLTMVKQCAFCNVPILKLGLLGQKIVERDGQIFHLKCSKLELSPVRYPAPVLPRRYESQDACNVRNVNDGIERTYGEEAPGDIYYDADGYETMRDFQLSPTREVGPQLPIRPKPQGVSQALLLDEFTVPDFQPPTPPPRLAITPKPRGVSQTLLVDEDAAPDFQPPPPQPPPPPREICTWLAITPKPQGDDEYTVPDSPPPPSREVGPWTPIEQKPQGVSQTLLKDEDTLPDVCFSGAWNIAGELDREIAEKRQNWDTLDDAYSDPYNLFEQPYFNHKRRMFVDVQLSSDITRWKFLSIQEAERNEGDDTSHSIITIGYSDERFDIPLLKEGSTLLYKAVIHLLPHATFFDIPVIIGIDLPTQLLSGDVANRISIYYSPTDVDDTPHWRPFIKTKTDESLDVHFEDDNPSYEKRNRAATCITAAQVILVLHHFCIFAVIVDKPVVKERVKTSVSVYSKLRVDESAYHVDVIVLAGCDENAMASEEQFVEETNGYLKVESNRFHSLKDEGDMTVRLSHNDVHWMKDAKIIDQQNYVYHAIDILAGVTKSAFTLCSFEAVRCGVESHCMFNVNITQIGRRPVVVKVSQDLHYLVTAGTVLPHCNCLRCSHHRHQSAIASCNAGTDEYDYASMDKTPPVPPRKNTFTSLTDMACSLPRSSTSDMPRRVKGSMHIYANLDGRQ